MRIKSKYSLLLILYSLFFIFLSLNSLPSSHATAHFPTVRLSGVRLNYQQQPIDYEIFLQYKPLQILQNFRSDQTFGLVGLKGKFTRTKRGV